MAGYPVLQISCLTRTVSKPRWSGSAAVASPQGVAVLGGRMTVLTGPPGIGTSEILRTVHNAHVGGTGRLVYRGRSGQKVQLCDLSDEARRNLREREFGFAGRLRPIPANLTPLDYVVGEVIRSGAQLEEARRRAHVALTRFGFDPARQGRPAGTLDPDESQRIDLAGALAKRPRLLLLDEPTRELAAEFRAVLADELRQLKRFGAAILAACRDASLTATLADEVIYLPARANAIA